MRIYADLHIHSRYSRATSSRLTLKALAHAAQAKGIAVLGTGDFTHPAWLSEIEESLVEAEGGLYRLRGDPCPTRFMLTAEISTIYKQDGKVRKVHHLVGVPGIEAARRVASRLAVLGNILSDGRPILGITSRDLAEIVLSSGHGAFVVPAHVWTPWFSALGSKSGFDSIEECYQDLASHVFAVETGLSSDPPMNWMVSRLDRYRLISCSDAHSEDKLGREATVFDVDLDYHAFVRAMSTGEGLAGTVEFFPEEGKYHLDGHRECGVVLEPHSSRQASLLCPVCGKPLTIGVLHRVQELADRPEGEVPPGARPFTSVVPLAEIISEIMQVASPTKRVMEAASRVSSALGGELPLLVEVPCGDIEAVGGPALATAIRRMRAGEVIKEPGYDGRFGKVRLFAQADRDLLFDHRLDTGPGRARRGRPPRKPAVEDACRAAQGAPVTGLSAEQLEAAGWGEGPLAVIAGPGTGKTRVLVERAVRLARKGEGPVLAVTFTVRAAREIAQRLEEGCGRDHGVDVCTFHSLAARILRETGLDFQVMDEGELVRVVEPALDADAGAWVEDLLYRQGTMTPLDREQEGLVRMLRAQGCFTYDGLVDEASRLVRAGAFTPRWRHVMVDEFQDINPVQHEFLKALVRGAASVLVIGDPNQAIYGFRGSSPAAFDDFRKDMPGARTVHIRDTYRFGRPIALAGNAVVGREAVRSLRDGPRVTLVRTPRPWEFVAREAEALSGGLTHAGVHRAAGEYPLSSIAVIVRTKSQALSALKALGEAGIPCDTAYARPLSETRGVAERIALLAGEDVTPYLKKRPARDDELKALARTLAAQDGSSVARRLARMEESGLFDLAPLPETHPLYSYALLFGSDTRGFIDFVRLTRDDAAVTGERVHVITAHAAKGLEFDCVFVAGLSRGVFPLKGSDPVQERNLFYVALTRARQRLYLVCPHEGESPYIGGIPEEAVREIVEKARKPGSAQLLLFE